MLLETKVLEGNMAVEQAEKRLGPATEGTPERAGRCDNADHRRHVAPCLGAGVTEKGPASRELINR